VTVEELKQLVARLSREERRQLRALLAAGQEGRDPLFTLDALAADLDLPEDLAEQHDHYLYGTPKHDTS